MRSKDGMGDKANTKKEGEDLRSHEDLVVDDTPRKPSENASPGAAPEARAVDDASSEAKKETLYLRAEFENTKRRLVKEQEQAIRFANEKIVGEMMTIRDLLERALTSAPQLVAKTAGTGAAKEIDSFVAGVEITYRELVHMLSRFGVEFIGVPGERFDPGRHEAVSERAAGEGAEGTVVEVLQKGCLLHGRLLVPARVVVGKG